jgi:hypothetical protein
VRLGALPARDSVVLAFVRVDMLKEPEVPYVLTAVTQMESRTTHE